MKTIFKDERPIKSIYYPDESHLTAGEDGVEEILPYGETDNSIWLAVFRRGRIDQRINIAFLESIVYS